MEMVPSISRFTTFIIINIIIFMIMIFKEFMIATDMSSSGDPAEKLR